MLLLQLVTHTTLLRMLLTLHKLPSIMHKALLMPLLKYTTNTKTVKLTSLLKLLLLQPNPLLTN